LQGGESGGVGRTEPVANVRREGISAVDVLERLLDKGIVIDYDARISMLGVDLLTRIEARVVVASIDTYLRYAPTLRQTVRLLDEFQEPE
jgi:gas vesicle protein GvpA/GvpJ/GvpM family